MRLIKRMDRHNASQQVWAVTGLLSSFIQRDKPFAAVHTDKGWRQGRAAKHRNANLNWRTSKWTPMARASVCRTATSTHLLRLAPSPLWNFQCLDLSFLLFTEQRRGGNDEAKPLWMPISLVGRTDLLVILVEDIVKKHLVENYWNQAQPTAQQRLLSCDG